jgi:hypothetical protein
VSRSRLRRTRQRQIWLMIGVLVLSGDEKSTSPTCWERRRVVDFAFVAGHPCLPLVLGAVVSREWAHVNLAVRKARSIRQERDQITRSLAHNSAAPTGAGVVSP